MQQKQKMLPFILISLTIPALALVFILPPILAYYGNPVEVSHAIAQVLDPINQVVILTQQHWAWAVAIVFFTTSWQLVKPLYTLR